MLSDAHVAILDTSIVARTIRISFECLNVSVESRLGPQDASKIHSDGCRCPQHLRQSKGKAGAKGWDRDPKGDGMSSSAHCGGCVFGLHTRRNCWYNLKKPSLKHKP